MEIEKFNKAVELHIQIDELCKALDEINGSILSYFGDKSSMGISGRYVMFLDTHQPIRYILDRHDAEIRKELEAEIVRLKNEIERL